MALAHYNTTWRHGSYKDDIYNLTAKRENDQLFDNGPRGGILHFPKIRNPTIGFGFDLRAAGYTPAQVRTLLNGYIGDEARKVTAEQVQALDDYLKLAAPTDREMAALGTAWDSVTLTRDEAKSLFEFMIPHYEELLGLH